MSQIDSAVIDEVRARADIVDIVSQYVTLKRTGSHFKGLCPFHGEKTPSFIVSPDKQIYKCFGCGAGGNVFTFLMAQQQLSFGEVVRDLARQYGVVMRYEEADSEAEQFRMVLRKLNQAASLFFQAQLADPEMGREARTYLEGRGVSEAFQQRFQLGYAPNSWQALWDHLRAEGFEPTQLEKSGLFKPSERKPGFYDFFRHRVMFPIVGVNGDVLAFGGRTLDPELGAKYINSPETEIYTKGQHIYGLQLAKSAIRQKDRVILAEGYLDVMIAHQYGFAETVAGLGTALTPAQARQLLRFTNSKTVIMAYDADNAGQKATERSAEVLQEVSGDIPVRLQVMRIPDQEDPDTFLRKYGAEAFEQLLQQATAFSAHAFERILARHDLHNPVDKSMAAKACVDELLKIRDPVLQDEYVRYVAARLEIEEVALRDQIRQVRRKAGYQAKKQQQRFQPGQERTGRTPAPLPAQGPQRDFISELGLIYLLLEFPQAQAIVLEVLQPLQFLDAANEELRQYLVSMAEAGLDLNWQDLFIAFPEADMHQRLTEIIENPAFKQLDFEKSLADFSRNVKLKCLGLQMNRLSTEIQQAEQAGDQQEYQTLMHHYLELMQDFSRLKHTNQ